MAWFALLTALLALVIAAAPTERGEIRAQGFILVDESGNEWGRLGWMTEGEVSYPVVRVGEERGWQALMTIAQDTVGEVWAGVRAYDANRISRVGLWASRSEAHVSMNDGSGFQLAALGVVESDNPYILLLTPDEVVLSRSARAPRR